MKLYGPRSEETIVTWGDHRPACGACRTVEIERPATFINTCAQGSALLSEELVKRQAPLEKLKRQEIKEQARKAGVFKIGKSAHVSMKYVEDK